MINEELEFDYYSRVYQLAEDAVLKLNKLYSDPQINNVVKGLHDHCYGLSLIDDTELVSYQVYYIDGQNNLSGELLKLNLHDKNRNELLLMFCKDIARTYNLDLVEAYNTFQDQTRSMCEQIDYYTITANELQQYKDGNPMIAVKNAKGIIVLPFIKHSELYQYIFGALTVPAPLKGTSFVYLMHNGRNNLIKIGKSINPRHREKTLQAEEPEITMIAVWEASGQLERHLHNLYKHKRLRGEWFNLTYHELMLVKQNITEYLNTNQIS